MGAHILCSPVIASCSNKNGCAEYIVGMWQQSPAIRSKVPGYLALGTRTGGEGVGAIHGSPSLVRSTISTARFAQRFARLVPLSGSYNSYVEHLCGYQRVIRGISLVLIKQAVASINQRS